MQEKLYKAQIGRMKVNGEGDDVSGSWKLDYPLCCH